MSDFCSTSGCARVSVVGGLCRKHYHEFRPRAECSVPECGRRVYSLGICESHYKHQRKYGNLQLTARLPHSDSCSVPGCGRKYSAKGFCTAHYNQLLRAGDVGVEIRPQRKRGTGSITSYGYKMVQRIGHPNAYPSGAIQEHRLVVSDFLKRPLNRNENIHHRNGDRLENTVGPCLFVASCSCSSGPHNLEVWHTGQPKGQRIADKIQWALSILSQYPDVG